MRYPYISICLLLYCRLMDGTLLIKYASIHYILVWMVRDILDSDETMIIERLMDGDYSDLQRV